VNPDIALFHFPSSGTPRDAAASLMSTLFQIPISETDIPIKTVHAVISGKVQGVGFRKWLWRHAHLHALSGWVRNNRENSVEALFSGPINAVDHMLSLCSRGPKKAAVRDCAVTPEQLQPEPGFFITDMAIEERQ
jgi:acylphosphatase